MAKKPAGKKKSEKKAKVAAAEPKKKSLKWRPEKRSAPVRKGPPISNVYRLFVDSLTVVRKNWKVFTGIFLVYVLFSLVLASPFATGTNVRDWKAEFSGSGNSGELDTSVTIFGILLSTFGGSQSEGGTAFQTFFLIIVSLAVIWVLRQALAEKKVTTSEAFYNGMYPLAPFILVLMVVALQLVPLFFGAVIMTATMGHLPSLAPWEVILWCVLSFGLLLLTLYWICSSIFAIYIVTLPDMRPMQALRSASELVRGRRWTVMRKLLFFPFMLLLILGFVIIPLIVYVPIAAAYIFVILSIIGFFLTHSYIYNLYRELL